MLSHLSKCAKIEARLKPVAVSHHPLALRQVGCQSMADSTKVIRTFKYRLYPSKSQEQNLLLILDIARH